MAKSTELTKNQRLVFDALNKAQAPLSAYSLLDQLRDDGFRAPLQVYRALEKLQQFGMVHRLESLNAFVACAHPHDHRHGLMAFAICDACGQVTEFSDEAIESRLGVWARDSGFHAEKTTIEIRGNCAACHTH